MPPIVAPIIAVFAFQLEGREYHPPVGDQTCLGYLVVVFRERRRRKGVSPNQGIGGEREGGRKAGGKRKN